MIIKNVVLKNEHNKPADLNDTYVKDIKKFVNKNFLLIEKIKDIDKENIANSPFIQLVNTYTNSSSFYSSMMPLIIILLSSKVIDIPFLKNFTSNSVVCRCLCFLEENVAVID